MPPPGEWCAAYAKARVRDAIDFPMAGVAAALRRDGDVIGGLRMAITGTNSAPLMIDTGELVGRAWGDDAAATLALALRKKANVLRTTMAGPKARRRAMQGMARRLMDTVLDACRERGIRAVVLHASPDGRPLYESLGFSSTNEMRLML